jgi:hypothetical protein
MSRADRRKHHTKGLTLCGSVPTIAPSDASREAPMADPIEDTADDWQLAALIGIAGAVGGGAGMFFFAIQSKKVNSLEPMIFTAAGVGMGGNNSGVPYDTFKNAMSGKSLPFSPVTVVTPFSIRMLHTSAGLYGGFGIGIPVASYGWSYLDAGRNGVKFFTSSGTGATVGSGMGAVAMAGTWYSYKLNGNSINPVPAYKQSITDSITDFFNSIERGIRGIYGAP